MGRSPSIVVGDAHDGLRVEHVKSRGLVRLTRWSDRSAQDDALGLEVSDFCARLGITTDVLGAAGRQQYLLVGEPARAGARHTVALFAAEQDARAEFVRFRRSEQGPGAWAELALISGGSEMRRICWFGPERRRAGAPQSSPGPTRRRRLRFPSRS